MITRDPYIARTPEARTLVPNRAPDVSPGVGAYDHDVAAAGVDANGVGSTT